MAGSVPAGMGSQKPRRPGWAHPSHVPSHTVSQQYPSTQLPLAHSEALVQSWPLAFLQTKPTQI